MASKRSKYDAAFKFYLFQWQAIDEQCYVITVLALSFHGNLISNLKLIHAPVIRVYEADPPRILRRLNLMKRYHHEEAYQIFPRESRTRSSHGQRTPQGSSVAMGNLIHHSDRGRGSQYLSIRYSERLDEAEVIHRKSSWKSREQLELATLT